MNGPFVGKYRAVVTSNQDPLMLGRVRARVPDVYGDEDSGWALPALPYAGRNVGLYLVPPEGANIWVEFEQGNAEYPIWTGCFWGDGQNPATTAASQPGPTTLPSAKVLKTDSCTFTLDDAPGSGGITIEFTGGIKITMKQTGVEITNGMGASINLSGISVSINQGALEVM